MRVGWHAKSYDPTMASIRVRLLEPMAYLQERGIKAETYCQKVGPQYDLLIFSKSFCHKALDIARAARFSGKPVVFDICDNIFGGKARIDTRRRIGRVKEMLSLATHVTFSTPVLAHQVQQALPEVASKSHIIPDTMDNLSVVNSSPCIFAQRELEALRHFLGSHVGALHCVWFGKSQGTLSGIAHLGAAVAELEKFSRTHPVTLTIISNKRWLCWRARREWKLPTHYMPWSLATFEEGLKCHQVAIIPVERNQYTRGKTINRPATAIAAGLGVVADSIDSYEELRPFIPLNDWQGGLRQYVERAPSVDERLEAARQHLQLRYGRDAIGRMWQNLLEQIAANPNPA